MSYRVSLIRNFYKKSYKKRRKYTFIRFFVRRLRYILSKSIFAHEKNGCRKLTKFNLRQPLIVCLLFHIDH